MNCEVVTRAEIEGQTLNGLSQPGALHIIISKVELFAETHRAP